MFAFPDYSTLQSKIQGISNGGSLNFQYSSNDNNCDFICKSNQVQKGCEFGFKCKVSSKCQRNNCLCTMQMSCNGKSSGNSATFDGNSENSATLTGNLGNLLNKFAGHSGNSGTISGKIENSASFAGNSGNSATFDGNSATFNGNSGNSEISAERLGLVKT